MKNKLIIIFLFFTINLIGQVTITEDDKSLLIDPNLHKDSSIGVINYYTKEYQEKILELENELSELNNQKRINEKSKRRIKIIEKDISSFEEYYSYWIEEKDEYNLVFGYDEKSCYQLETDQGIKTEKEIKLEVIEEKKSVEELIEIEVEKKMGWVKKETKKGCYSQDPKDCTVMCYQVIAEIITIHFDDASFEIKEIPKNYTYDENRNVLIKEYEIIELENTFIDSDNLEKLDVLKMKKINCE